MQAYSLSLGYIKGCPLKNPQRGRCLSLESREALISVVTSPMNLKAV